MVGATGMDCFYPRGVISEDVSEIVGCKIVPLFENIHRKDATLAHL